jgi:hypothetical protein
LQRFRPRATRREDAWAALRPDAMVMGVLVGSPHFFGGVAEHDRAGIDVPPNNASGTDDRVVADSHTGDDRHIRADEHARTDANAGDQ